MIYPFTTSCSCCAELVPCFKQNDRSTGYCPKLAGGTRCLSCPFNELATSEDCAPHRGSLERKTVRSRVRCEPRQMKGLLLLLCPPTQGLSPRAMKGRPALPGGLLYNKLVEKPVLSGSHVSSSLFYRSSAAVMTCLYGIF
ncbi:hypothetical protein HJG60_009099 [Phyllostomus discolor]|uniref:Uncharacterized protein n=1 Tax=Phyllostomus discolor TaxID=89673 RepID=A0A834DCT2_9CHIR|nr:hypothetical protein HJG60_009099 [Phyllostomus discolor]